MAVRPCTQDQSRRNNGKCVEFGVKKPRFKSQACHSISITLGKLFNPSETHGLTHKVETLPLSVN